MKPKTTSERHWVVFRNGCIHGVHCSQMVVLRSVPRRSFSRDTVSVVTLSKSFSLIAVLLVAAALLLLLTGCRTPRPQQGGAASSRISGPGHTNAVTLMQSENPKQPSYQTVRSEQTIEYVLPPGTAVPLGNGSADASLAAPPKSTLLPSGALAQSEQIALVPPTATLTQPMPVKYLIRDHTETSIGGAQKDLARELAAKAASLQPVMWAGIAMMTLVAGALAYFGWWTKAVLALAVGLLMIVVAQVLPDQGTAIILAGIGVFGLLALLVLYAYHKGQLDQNNNGIPDFLEKDLSTVTKPSPPPTT